MYSNEMKPILYTDRLCSLSFIYYIQQHNNSQHNINYRWHKTYEHTNATQLYSV